MDVHAPDLDSPPHRNPLEPDHAPLTPDTISDQDLLRATLQGRALGTPLGWYRVPKSWTKHTVKALRYLANPGKGLHDTNGDLIL